MFKLFAVEKIILLLVFAIVVTGFILFYTDPTLFRSFVQEDGLVEWLTVLGLMLGCIVCIGRFINLRKFKSAWFLFVTASLAFLLFFAAGEEISWGQRIFGIKSSEFFAEKNSQGETNLHNLVVDGVKINKIIFSIGLVSAMGIYLVVLPLLYSRKNVKNFVDHSGIPLPRAYQVISILFVFGATSLLADGKRAELLEAGITLLFFLIIKYPANSGVFKRPVTNV